MLVLAWFWMWVLLWLWMWAFTWLWLSGYTYVYIYIYVYVYINILIQIQSDMYGQGNHPGIILRSLFSAAAIPVSSWSRRLPRRRRQYFAKKLRQRSHHPIEMWPTRMNHPSGHLQAWSMDKSRIALLMKLPMLGNVLHDYLDEVQVDSSKTWEHT